MSPATPAQAEAPRPATLSPRPKVDWRDAPITPGTWSWGMSGAQSVASFADGELALVCDRKANAMTLLRRGVAQGSVPVTIITFSQTRPLEALALDRLPATVAITFDPRDPLLDAMAFSRGRFVIEVQGLEPLYVPSWPEVSRVVEDCR